MSGDFHMPAFDVNAYERVNQQWMCGRESDGTPCTRGPNSRGECGAVCQPLKVGDHFFCENAATLSGQCDDGPLPDGSCPHCPARCTPFKKGASIVCGLGACPDGPRADGTCCQPVPPCRPVRRVLGKRKLLTLSVLALALGFGLLMVGGPGHEQIMSPGRLTSQHSAVADRCSACHDVGDGTLVDWLHAAVDSSDRTTLDTQCFACHREMQNRADSPHGADPDVLAALTQKAEQRESRGGSFMLSLARRSMSHSGGIACSTCHREHRGEHHDLTAMTDTQCQTCHASAFASFSDGHPEFTDYPYVRRSRIYFDHVSHYGAHFREAGRLPAGEAAREFLVEGEPLQQTCVRCHAADNAGRKMLVRPFEQTCGACHADQIEDDSSAGLLVLGLPVFDKTRLGQRDSTVWPFDGAKHPEAEGAVSPILRLLLSANPQYARLDRQVASLDLLSLDGANEEQLEAVGAMPKMLAEEIGNMASQGQSGIRARLADALGEDVTSDQIRQLAKLLEADALESVHEWFLGEDFGSRRPDAGGLFLNPRELSLRYRPVGHADPVLRAWIDVSVRLGHNADEETPIRQIYRSLSQVTASGRCLKCHTIESRPDGSASVNWLPYQGQSLGSFATYAHHPHILTLQDDSCMQCHVLNSTAEKDASWSIFRAEFVDLSGHPLPGFGEFHANFQPLRKTVCVTCHQTGRVVQNCTTCHSYHVTAPAAAP